MKYQRSYLVKYNIKNKSYKKQVIGENKLNKSMATDNQLLSSLPAHISMFSLVLFMGGFLYNFYFFSNININVSNFLTLSDYVETSLTKILIPLFNTSIMLFTAIYISKNFNGGYKEKILVYIVIVVTYVMCFTAIDYGSITLSTYIVPILFTGIFILAFILDVTMGKFFPENKIIVFYIAILVIYSAGIYLIANQDSQFIRDYKKFKKHSSISYEFTNIKDEKIKVDLYIKSTSRYHIFYHTDDKNITYPIFILNSQIKQIRVIRMKNKNKNSWG